MIGSFFMSEKVDCIGNKFEPIGYDRLSWEKYSHKLDKLEMNNDNKTDKLGLERMRKKMNTYSFSNTLT
jgi:hypothetical protein